MGNTAKKIEIEREETERKLTEAEERERRKKLIVHYKRVYYVLWDRVFLAVMILAALLIMVFGHVEVSHEKEEAQEQMAAFYSELEAEERYHEYQQQQIRETEARKEAEAKAEAEKQRQKEIYEKMQEDENRPATTTTTSTTYVPRME